MGLNPFQQEISNLARRLGLRGSAETQVYQRPEFAQLVNQFFGAIPLPAGINESMVTARSGGGLTYLDPQGYEHILERNLNALDPRLGEVGERSTNRPAVLPVEKTNPILGQVLGLVGGTGTPTGGGDGQYFGLPFTGNENATTQGANQSFNPNISALQQMVNELRTPVGLSNIDPQTMQALQAIKAAEDQALQEQFDRDIGTTIAQLVGRGVGASSIAGDTLSRVKQGQGLVRNQAQANQAQREVGIREFLTGADATRRQGLQQFIQGLLSEGTQRDISGAQIGVQREGQGIQNEQFFSSLQESIRQFNEQLRMQERQNLINNIFKGVAAGTSIATGIAGGFGSGGGSAFGGNSLYLTPPTFPRNPYGNVNA